MHKITHLSIRVKENIKAFIGLYVDKHKKLCEFILFKNKYNIIKKIIKNTFNTIFNSSINVLIEKIFLNPKKIFKIFNLNFIDRNFIIELLKIIGEI